MNATFYDLYGRGFEIVKQGGEYGIEIEVEGNRLADVDGRIWMAKGDGSLRGRAVEYVLRSPLKLNECNSALDRLKERFKEASTKINDSDRCAVHIHINFQDNTVKDIIKFATIYYSVEDLVLKRCGEEREGNFFCLRAKDAYGVLAYIRQAIEMDNLVNLITSPIRYSALNFNALSQFGSVEFRGIKTPQDLDEIKMWLNIFDRLKKKALEVHEPFDIIEAFSRDGADYYIKELFYPYHDEFMFPDRESLLFDGVRRAQIIAYAQPKKNKKKETVNFGDDRGDGPVRGPDNPFRHARFNPQPIEPPPPPRPRRTRKRALQEHRNATNRRRMMQDLERLWWEGRR